MSAFELFFSLFGLILGLAIANVAANASDILRDRNRIPIGWLTPCLVVFVLFDLTSFWIVSYSGLQNIHVGFPSMVWAVAMAVTYFFAASMIFPKKMEEWASLDEYYLANYRWVIGGALVANLALLGLISVFSGRGLADWWLAAAQRPSNWLYFGLLAVLLIFRHRIVHLIAWALGIGSYVLLLALSPGFTE